MTPPAAAEGDASRGLVTLAVGHPRYLEMAVDLALSARAHTDLPFVLVADDALARRARSTYPAVFTDVREVPPRYRVGRAVKYGVVEAAPFARGIYVDADCLLLGSLDAYWPALEGAAVALVGERLGPADHAVHHGFDTRALVRRFGLSSYLKCNSGVFYFERASAVVVMDDCLACHRDEILPTLRGGFLGDELALGVVGGRRGLSIFPAPSPMAWPDALARLDPARPEHPVCHFLAPVAPSALETLIRDATARRREADVPGDAAPHWRWKQRRSARGMRLERILRPLLPLARRLGLRATRHF